jgi:hypothetical protein
VAHALLSDPENESLPGGFQWNAGAQAERG